VLMLIRDHEVTVHESDEMTASGIEAQNGQAENVEILMTMNSTRWILVPTPMHLKVDIGYIVVHKLIIY